MAKYKQGLYTPVYPHKYIQPADKYMNKGLIPEYRSSWELKFMRFCDANPLIIRWGVEPFPIHYISPKDNKQHRYFIDGFIEWQNGAKFIVEIKPKAQCSHPKPPKKPTPKNTLKYQQDILTFMVNQAKWKAAEEFAKKNGLKFIVLTEHELGI